jgi:hypothetical protein
MTPEQYIAAIAEPKQSELARLHALIRKTAPTFEPVVHNGMIGYGRYHYRYPSGREGDSFRIALAGNKTGISVYVSVVDDGGYLAEQAKDELGKASVGKSCIRFKQLSDIDLGVLATVLRRAKKGRAIGETTAVAGAGEKRVDARRATRKSPKKATTAAKRTSRANARR